MAAFELTYIGQSRMYRRVGTCHAYPKNEATEQAIMELEWAYNALQNPCATFQNGRTSHECANERIERNEDVLIDYLRVLAH